MPWPNRSPTMFMPAISGPSITCSGRPPPARMPAQHSSVSATMKSVMPCTSAWLRRPSTVAARHASRAESSLAAPLAFSAISTSRSPGRRRLPFGDPGAPVQHDVLDTLAQDRIELVVHAHHAGVDDAHVHARLDGVVQEHGVDGLAHRVVAAEAERHVGHAARHLGAGQVLLDPARGLDEVHRVVVVLLDARGDGEDVGVEDDVLGREADLVDQHAVGARADVDLALVGVGLAGLVEGHHHRRGAVAAHQAGLALELGLAFLQRDAVDDALALDALQAGFDDLPLGAVDHDRHARDLGLAGDQVQEAHHRRLRIQHGLVHVDVDDLCAVLHLLAGHRERLLELAVQDQPGEGLGAGDVGALADVDEQGPVVDGHRLEAGQLHRRHGGTGFGWGVHGRQSRHRRAAELTAASRSGERG